MASMKPPLDQKLSNDEALPETRGEKVIEIVIDAPAAIVEPTAGKPVAVKYLPILLVVATVMFVYVIGAASGFCQAKPVKVRAVLPSFERIIVCSEVCVAEPSTTPPKSTVWRLAAR
jgi:hypothetical protein